MTTRETEIKLAMPDAGAAEKLIQKVPLLVKEERHFEDNLVFDSPDGRLRDTGLLLRVRIANSEATLTYKGKTNITDGVKDREEIECIATPPETLLLIFERLGYLMMFRYQKYRTVYDVQGFNLHLCVDETPIGTYLELEGDIQDIHRCAAELGFNRENYITESYGVLYSRWCREKNIQPANMTFE